MAAVKRFYEELTFLKKIIIVIFFVYIECLFKILFLVEIKLNLAVGIHFLFQNNRDIKVGDIAVCYHKIFSH